MQLICPNNRNDCHSVLSRHEWIFSVTGWHLEWKLEVAQDRTSDSQSVPRFKTIVEQQLKLWRTRRRREEEVCTYRTIKFTESAVITHRQHHHRNEITTKQETQWYHSLYHLIWYKLHSHCTTLCNSVNTSWADIIISTTTSDRDLHRKEICRLNLCHFKSTNQEEHDVTMTTALFRESEVDPHFVHSLSLCVYYSCWSRRLCYYHCNEQVW